MVKFQCFHNLNINISDAKSHFSVICIFKSPYALIEVLAVYMLDHEIMSLTSTRAWSRRCVRGPKGQPSSGDSCWDSDFFNSESTSTVVEREDEC